MCEWGGGGEYDQSRRPTSQESFGRSSFSLLFAWGTSGGLNVSTRVYFMSCDESVPSIDLLGKKEHESSAKNSVEWGGEVCSNQTGGRSEHASAHGVSLSSQQDGFIDLSLQHAHLPTVLKGLLHRTIQLADQSPVVRVPCRFLRVENTPREQCTCIT